MREKSHALVYVRVSTQRQADDGVSLDEQRRLGIERCEREGWTYEVVEDAGMSGARHDRPGIMAIRSKLRSADYVVVWKLDRLTRSTAQLTSLLDEFSALDVGIVSLTEPIDGTTPIGRAMIELAGIFAQLERSNASERTRMGKQASARSGGKNGGIRPFGYRRRDTIQDGARRGSPTGPLVLVSDEASTMRSMREGVLAGRSLSEIARDLNRRGVTTVRGVAWTQTRISQVLANSLYVGRVHYRDAEFEAQHEPIFTLDEWRELQATLASRRRSKSGGGGRVPKVHLLSRKMLRCGWCGASMVPRSTRNDQGRHYETYRCLGQLQGSSPDCEQPTVRREQIDEAVFAYFGRVGIDAEGTRRLISEGTGRALAEIKALLAAAERDEMRAQDLARRAFAEWERGSHDSPTLAFVERRIAEYEEQRAAAQAEADRLRRRSDEIAAEGSEIDAAEELLAYLAELRAAVAGRVRDGGSVEGVRAALLRLFDGFTLHSLLRLQDHDVADSPLPEGWLRSRLYGHPDLVLPGRGGFLIEPHPRAQSILDDDKEIAFPQLRRVALEQSVSSNYSGR